MFVIILLCNMCKGCVVSNKWYGCSFISSEMIVMVLSVYSYG